MDNSLHKQIGTQQKLFAFHELSPGSCFFLPHGTRIYNKLMDFMKSEYHKRDYLEVMTPNMYNCDLWKMSGHYDYYKDNMFLFQIDDQEWALKPQNCPGHCLMYRFERKSVHDLPIRYADFGVLHRNELSGALRGLTRVRRFQQDDAHIFCTLNQVESEIDSCLDFLDAVYGKLGLAYEMELSTRPEKYIGEKETWDHVEGQLKNSLQKFCDSHGKKFEINEGDGAFYGPKIDIKVLDSVGREFQCGTIQLDSQLPSKDRLNLTYQNEKDGWDHPLIIHRAIFGSVERMIAILAEHYNGDWPFWLSPRQIVLIPVFAKEPLISYGKKLKEMLGGSYFVDFDDSDERLKKKVACARDAKYNYALVFGEKDVQNGTVNLNDLRSSIKQDIGLGELKDFFAKLDCNF